MTMVFDRIDTHEWKNIEMRQESLKSVISMIIAQRDYWLLVGIDFITNTGKTLMFDAGDCVLNFTDKKDLFPCLQRILRDEDSLIPLYNLLCENIGDTIIYEDGDCRNMYMIQQILISMLSLKQKPHFYNSKYQ